MMYRAVFLLLLTVWLAIVAPRSAEAQGVSVVPLSWDFGPVLLGDPETFVFTIESTELTPLTVYSVSITPDPSPFSVVSAPPPSITLAMNDMLDFELMFSPIELGPFEALMSIDSDAEHPNQTVLVALQGTGVDTLVVSEPPALWVFILGLAGLFALACRRRVRRPA